MGKGVSVSLKKQGDVVIVAVDGEIDASSAPKFDGEMTKILDGGAKKIVIDMSKLSYIASAGLGVFMSVFTRLNKSGGKLKLAVMNESIKKVFTLTNYTKLFEIYKTVAEAQDSFK